VHEYYSGWGSVCESEHDAASKSERGRGRQRETGETRECVHARKGEGETARARKRMP